MRRFLIMTIAVFFLGGATFGSIVMNNISEIFPAEYRPGIENKLILGSVSFLRAHGIANELLAVFENTGISEFGANSLQTLVNNALNEIDKSLMYYKDAKSVGITAGYLTGKTENFKDFDYDSFSKSLEFTGIFQKVKELMVNNDVIGIHSENIENIEAIRTDLNDVKNILISGRMPVKEHMWKILTGFAKASLFANYATRVGSAVLAN